MTSPRSSTLTWRRLAANRASAKSLTTPTTSPQVDVLPLGGPETKAHGRAARGTRVRGDLAMLGLGQAADDEQADADAAEPAAVAGLALEEPVEDALLVAPGAARPLGLPPPLDPAAPHTL